MKIRRSGKQVPAAMALLSLLLLTGCRAMPAFNVLRYEVARRTGVYDRTPTGGATGTLAGRVMADDGPVAHALVVAADPRGKAYTDRTDAAGYYRIDGLPPGWYTPAAAATGYADGDPRNEAGYPVALHVTADALTQGPPIRLEPVRVEALPQDAAAAVALTQTAAFSAATTFPPGSAAQVLSYRFVRDGVTVDSLRVYLPGHLAPDARLPLLFFSYPGDVDGWQDVSVAFAAQGYALVALSPAGERGLDVRAHAEDARIALALARQGALTPHIATDEPIIVMGGSFTSAILYRLILMQPDCYSAWVTLGGIADAFSGAEAFYAGKLELPPAYAYVIPAMGPPNLAARELLDYSPVAHAGELPPTLIIHTTADRILPVAQAHALAGALSDAGVPVETFYYEDVSHYLQIGADLTPAGEEMFYRILDFVQRYQPTGNSDVQ
ncbi:MAG: carboxypeptidase regulatory-like domain-containing protein [Caldilineaceae bacterium]|nr:carboxypeptidase regulatory-like domain-containing protein [Caldilineaceae bacterium]